MRTTTVLGPGPAGTSDASVGSAHNSAANGRKRKSCPAGTGNATHCWIDESPAPQRKSNPRLRPPAIQGFGPGAIRWCAMRSEGVGRARLAGLDPRGYPR
jgi:hypothetical protein